MNFSLGTEALNYFKCSRAECSFTANYKLIWHNPKIHTDGRTKTWLSCNEHLDFLQNYLQQRQMLLKVESFE